MKIAKLPFLGMVSGLAGLAAVATATPVYAQSQNCYATHSAGFARVRGLENKATTQGTADLEVRALFGPRIGSPTLNASMDDVRIYSRVLSWSEVLDIPFQVDAAPYY